MPTDTDGAVFFAAVKAQGDGFGIRRIREAIRPRHNTAVSFLFRVLNFPDFHLVRQFFAAGETSVITGCVPFLDNGSDGERF